jgi:membrane glycosyltransferase
MVESALLRRRGWAVHMVMIGGSYEEYPPTIVDHALRDRRWMQGNLQHLRCWAPRALPPPAGSIC